MFGTVDCVRRSQFLDRSMKAIIERLVADMATRRIDAGHEHGCAPRSESRMSFVILKETPDSSSVSVTRRVCGGKLRCHQGGNEGFLLGFSAPSTIRSAEYHQPTTGLWTVRFSTYFPVGLFLAHKRCRRRSFKVRL